MRLIQGDSTQKFRIPATHPACSQFIYKQIKFRDLVLWI